MTTRKAAPKKAAPKATAPEHLYMPLMDYNPVAKPTISRYGSSKTVLITEERIDGVGYVFEAVINDNYDDYSKTIKFGRTDTKVINGIMVDMKFTEAGNDKVVALAGVDRDGILRIVMVEQHEDGSISIHHLDERHGYPVCHDEGMLSYHVIEVVEAVVLYQAAEKIFS